MHGQIGAVVHGPSGTVVHGPSGAGQSQIQLLQTLWPVDLVIILVSREASDRFLHCISAVAFYFKMVRVIGLRWSGTGPAAPACPVRLMTSQCPSGGRRKVLAGKSNVEKVEVLVKKYCGKKIIYFASRVVI